jgi:hypothetical protein
MVQEPAQKTCTRHTAAVYPLIFGLVAIAGVINRGVCADGHNAFPRIDLQVNAKNLANLIACVNHRLRWAQSLCLLLQARGLSFTQTLQSNWTENDAG